MSWWGMVKKIFFLIKVVQIIVFISSNKTSKGRQSYRKVVVTSAKDRALAISLLSSPSN